MIDQSLHLRDLAHLWHPCSQMKDYEEVELLQVVAASGSYIELKSGRKIIDAISSWWCKSLGHAHPRLQQALKRQLEKFEHVILAGTTNETIVALSEKLADMMPSLNKVFYASEGSCAIEIAMKMSRHARKIAGDENRTLFIALENGYHGETLGALSVSDVGIYREPYQSFLFPCEFIKGLPYVLGINDPLWSDCGQYWDRIEKQLEPYSETATAIMLEPIVQGAGGMKIYSADFLRRLRKWTKERGIHLIADEIMTGLYRTGKKLACEHADIQPDFICLSKGMTSGFLPLSAVLTSQHIYDHFYHDYEEGKSFLHSHTYSGNALAASVAIETLKIMQEENIEENVRSISMYMQAAMEDIAAKTGKLENVRGIGAMMAADLLAVKHSRPGFALQQEAIKQGALIRPLGKTIYWMPPLNIVREDLVLLHQISAKSIHMLV